MSCFRCGTKLNRSLIFAFLFTFLPYFVYLAINLAILLTERRSLGGTPDAKSRASQLAESLKRLIYVLTTKLEVHITT